MHFKCLREKRINFNSKKEIIVERMEKYKRVEEYLILCYNLFLLFTLICLLF